MKVARDEGQDAAGGMPQKGVRPFAVAVALSVAVLIFVAYDGQISRSEGGMMVLLALAVGWQMLQAKTLFRPEAAATVQSRGGIAVQATMSRASGRTSGVRPSLTRNISQTPC